ncbi:kinase-like domain-containing protein [Aspergillus lucknowensis]|uniref:Kinase-like domain-containing protein n=1 Tax=Aspergillus lucknowensis TaxID=176173 RepID=A0ABR4LDU7_9EURO
MHQRPEIQMGFIRLFSRYLRFSEIDGKPLLFRKSMATYPAKNQMAQTPYISSVDAEPLHRYKPSGYHPTLLGDVIHSGRYKILHKLGWGGYSTVWAARDTRRAKYVAVKICIAEQNRESPIRELHTMEELASRAVLLKHVVQMLDKFVLEGPNGSHQCLVYELLGPSVPDICDAKFSGGRLPGRLAKSIAKQSLAALDELHQLSICHGDLHTRNLAFTMPCMDGLSEEKFMQALGKPEIGPVQWRNGEKLSLQPEVPSYIVRPAAPQTQLWDPDQPIKLIDFGESFSRDTVPRTLHTPLSLRAPEVIFRDRFDYRVDLWSMGCLLFELFTGQPPFDSFMITPPILIEQMRELASDDFPRRWQEMADTVYKKEEAETESPGPNLHEWLQEVYFERSITPDLDKADIERLGQIIARLLRFEPSTRASAREVLEDQWLNE